ncbi:hypothetical protein [Rubripirellula obstinata]|nr:hypothetical protein [Rubripirellula obstinata]
MNSATQTLIRYTALPLFFLVVHTVAVACFAMTEPPAAGPNSDSAAMAWVLWVYIDFPLGLASLWAISNADSNALAVLSVLLIGGIQWILWGIAANTVIGLLRSFVR